MAQGSLIFLNIILALKHDYFEIGLEIEWLVKRERVTSQDQMMPRTLIDIRTAECLVF